MSQGKPPGAPRDMAREMSTDRPLDALIPELRPRGPSVAPTAVHQRVLEAEVDGATEWVFSIWRDPGNGRALHEAVKKVIEATMLADLSRPAREGAEALGARRGGLRLMSFAPLSEDPAPALRAFGLRPVPHDAAASAARMTALREEAREMGWFLPDMPQAVWHAPIRWPAGTLGERLLEVHATMADRMGDDLWGATPGAPSRLFAHLCESWFQERFTPDLAGLRSMELLLVSRDPDVVRWIPPLLFQALCDFVGVVIQAEYDRKVDWAVCEPDETGLAPPPLFRIRQGTRTTYLPIGLHLLRWCIMPIGEDEEVPTLADWLASEFGG